MNQKHIVDVVNDQLAATTLLEGPVPQEDHKEALTQDLGDVVTVLRDLVEPALNVDEGLGVGDVVHDDDSVGVSVVPVHRGRASGPRGTA